MLDLSWDFQFLFGIKTTKKVNIHVNFANVLWVEFSIPSGSLSLEKYLVLWWETRRTVNILV
jgi:hypothetical protein